MRYEHGFPVPRLYVDGDAVRELQCIGERAGIVRSAERWRNALSEAMAAFDRHLIEPGIDDLVR